MCIRDRYTKQPTCRPKEDEKQEEERLRPKPLPSDRDVIHSGDELDVLRQRAITQSHKGDYSKS